MWGGETPHLFLWVVWREGAALTPKVGDLRPPTSPSGPSRGFIGPLRTWFMFVVVSRLDSQQSTIPGPAALFSPLRHPRAGPQFAGSVQYNLLSKAPGQEIVDFLMSKQLSSNGTQQCGGSPRSKRGLARGHLDLIFKIRGRRSPIREVKIAPPLPKPNWKMWGAKPPPLSSGLFGGKGQL